MEKAGMTCNFSKEGVPECKRENMPGSGLCIFHSSGATSFKEEFGQLLKNKDGEWRGFIFPHGFKIDGRSIDGNTIDFPVTASWSSAPDLTISHLTFEKSVDFSHLQSEECLKIDRYLQGNREV